MKGGREVESHMAVWLLDPAPMDSLGLPKSFVVLQNAANGVIERTEFVLTY